MEARGKVEGVALSGDGRYVVSAGNGSAAQAAVATRIASEVGAHLKSSGMSGSWLRSVREWQQRSFPANMMQTGTPFPYRPCRAKRS